MNSRVKYHLLWFIVIPMGILLANEASEENLFLFILFLFIWASICLLVLCYAFICPGCGIRMGLGYYKLFLSGKKIYAVSPIIGKKCSNCGFDFTGKKNKELY